MILVQIMAARIDVPVCASFWYYLSFFLFPCMNLGSHGHGGGCLLGYLGYHTRACKGTHIGMVTVKRSGVSCGLIGYCFESSGAPRGQRVPLSG